MLLRGLQQVFFLAETRCVWAAVCSRLAMCAHQAKAVSLTVVALYDLCDSCRQFLTALSVREASCAPASVSRSMLVVQPRPRDQCCTGRTTQGNLLQSARDWLV